MKDDYMPLTDFVDIVKTAEVEIGTSEFIHDGNYLRIMTAPAGALIIGKVHKKETINVLMKGTIRLITTESTDEVLEAPCVFISNPMVRKIGLAETEVFFLNITKTELTNTDDIEEELFMSDDYFMDDEQINIDKITEVLLEDYT